MQSGLPLTSGGYWTLATHQICSTFWKHSPPSPLLALSPSSFSTPLCGKHIFCYRINLMIISIHEVSHCKQYCTIRAFRYSIVGSDQLFWGRGGLLVCTSRGVLEPAAVAGDCNSADGKFMLSIRTL